MNESLRSLTQYLGKPERHAPVAPAFNRCMMIGLYTPAPVEYLPYNSNARSIAQLVADAILNRDPSLSVEHIGSTAVRGCWGKGTIDLLVSYKPGGLADARNTLDSLGFQRQRGPEAFPESRPMRVGSVKYLDRVHRLHAHVIESGHSEARDLVRFRDLLRENPGLRYAYEAEKRTILARGITTGFEYSDAKGGFIRRTLAMNAAF